MEIAEEKEDSEGEIVGINWDDDNNGEGNGGHGKLVFKNDFDDAEGTAGEDDLIQLKLHKPAIDGAKARLKYDSAFVKIWKNGDRTDEVKSEETEIELTEDKIVYLEGRTITEAEKPKEIEMQIKVGSTGDFAPGDKVSVHVATPIITFYGKHEWTSGQGSRNLAEQLHDKKFLGKNRRDDRNNTVILKGKNQQGKTLWYSVDMVDITPFVFGDLKLKRPEIRVRAPNLDKEMKMALSLEGAHVFYNGHSNYGLGPNFKQDPTTLDDYMNITGRGKTRINYEELITFHGDRSVTLRAGDIVTGSISNTVVPATGTQMKFGDDAILLRNTTPPGHEYHCLMQQNDSHPVFSAQPDDPAYTPWAGYFAAHGFWMKKAPGTNYGIIVNTTGDLPQLRYASCFMASCNTGKHFSESLTHGVLLFSMDETYGVLGGADGQLDDDLTTGGYSWGITHYVKLLTGGKSWTEIVTFFNQNQSFSAPETEPENLHNYKFKPF